MSNITFFLGLHCVFIRYNPDNKKVTEETKHKKLLEKLKFYLKYDIQEAIKINYLFYQ